MEKVGKSTTELNLKTAERFEGVDRGGEGGGGPNSPLLRVNDRERRAKEAKQSGEGGKEPTRCHYLCKKRRSTPGGRGMGRTFRKKKGTIRKGEEKGKEKRFIAVQKRQHLFRALLKRVQRFPKYKTLWPNPEEGGGGISHMRAT